MSVDDVIRYTCKCGQPNEWKVNKVRQRGQVELLRDGDDAGYDVYSVPCQKSGCRWRRRIRLLREGA